MKKDNVFCLRMNATVRGALKREAEKERRSVSSLLDNVIMDYLEKKATLGESTVISEQRRFPRIRVNLPARVRIAIGSQQINYPCVVLDLSLSGVLVTYPKGSDIQLIARGKLPSFELSFQLPHAEDELHFSCKTRHIGENGAGLHVGAMFDEPAEDDLKRLQTYLN